MKKLTLFIFSFICMAVSCEEQELQLDPTQNPLDQAPLWESERLSEPERNATTPHEIYLLPTSQKSTLVGMTDAENKVRYVSLNVETGKRKAVSGYFTERYTQSSFPETSEITNGIFYFIANENEYEEGDNSPISSEQPILGFDVETGELVYDKLFGDGFIPRKMAIMNHYMTVLGWKQNGEGTSEYLIRYSKGPEFTDWKSLKVPLVNSMLYGGSTLNSFQSGFVMIEDEGGTFLNYVMAEPKFEGASMSDLQGNSIFHINCYNLDREEWLYKNLSCPGGGNAVPQTDKYVYYGATALGNATGGLRAYDWKTGKLAWHMARKDFDATRQVTLGAEAKYVNTIVSNNVGYMYGIDATNGTLKWKKPGIGNATSSIVFHNGVAYSTSLGGFLYGIDVETGERLLKASCPSEGRTVQGRRLDGFTTSIGKHVRDDSSAVLICQNFMYAYAFEAVR